MLDLLAIDISKWQARIDGANLKASGVELVIVKSSQGMNKDPKFEAHANEVVRSNQILAAYHWNDPILPALEQADFFAEVIKNYPVKFLGQDQEQWWKSWAEYRVLGIRARRFPSSYLGDHALKFYSRAFNKSGIRVLTYTNPNYVNTYCPQLFTQYLKVDGAWMAQWPWAYQPPDRKKGVFITWENLKANIVPYRKSPFKPSGVKEAFGWQWTGDYWKLPYVYKQMSGTSLSTLDINLFNRYWLNQEVPPPPPVPQPLYTAWVNATKGLNVRKGPGTSYGIWNAIPYKSSVSVWKEKDGWVAIDEGLTKWVYAYYLTKY